MLTVPFTTLREKIIAIHCCPTGVSLPLFRRPSSSSVGLSAVSCVRDRPRLAAEAWSNNQVAGVRCAGNYSLCRCPLVVPSVPGVT